MEEMNFGQLIWMVMFSVTKYSVQMITGSEGL